MSNDLCFVLMPFDPLFDSYYKEIYVTTIERANLLPKRADSLFRPSTIISDVWSFILQAKIIVADISGLNPNVMYELGLAHAVAKPVIIISDDISNVPFDLRSLRILVYDKNQPDWSRTLSEKLYQSILETLASPLEAVLPTFMNIRPSKQEEVGELKGSLIEIKQLLHRQIEELIESKSDTKTRKSIVRLNADEYGNAVKDAHDLYYSKGLETADIRQYLITKYSVSYDLAADILHSAMNRPVR